MTDATDATPTPKRVLLGRILGAHGLRGDVRIESWTDPRTAIFKYQPWLLVDARGQVRELRGARGHEGGKSLIARIPDVEDRDAAEALRGIEIHVTRDVLPPPKADEFYWVDLEGLDVVTVDGVPLGRVAHLFSTGANDVMVVRDDTRERMVPFVRPQFVTAIDLAAGRITVDWDPDF